MTGRSDWYAVLPLATVCVAAPAHATVYLSVEQAQRLMFPSARLFVDQSAALTAAQRQALAKAPGKVVRIKGLRVWEARGPAGRLGWLLVDRVLGKHDFITYALALDPAATVRGVEILEYRESYGGEIRNANWRRQFVGKRHGSSLQLGRDIGNISGATLSCRHVTDGVKRLLATVDMLLRSA